MGKKKILVVEDDFIFAEKLISAFKNSGFDVAHVTGATDAFAILSDFRPDGISLDMQLEEEFGLHILNTLVSDYSPLDYKPVVFVVSAMLNPSLIRVLRQHQIPHYNKLSPSLTPKIIADTFQTYLTFENPFDEQFLQHNQAIPTADLKKIVEKKLSFYHFNEHVVAYPRLVSVIVSAIEVNEITALQKLPIFHDEDEYHNAYKGISKLIKDAYTENPALFEQYFSKKVSSKIRFIKPKESPTVKDFINHIITDIKSDLDQDNSA